MVLTIQSLASAEAYTQRKCIASQSNNLQRWMIDCASTFGNGPSDGTVIQYLVSPVV